MSEEESFEALCRGNDKGHVLSVPQATNAFGRTQFQIPAPFSAEEMDQPSFSTKSSA
jgi:hypothetical protein